MWCQYFVTNMLNNILVLSVTNKACVHLLGSTVDEKS